ncbi:hypothetical protein JAAARDRAFT_188628 [Jaapia argillacea MUCL 33604]|uniref:MYND-type domain-containing protein n=1 Tax=Jaapia argillacea MUCL 33604 TaxID=933084 RepID=A0A067Q7S3_9AGAM|nr:hypothetical protein JAAARDRAFT_188628 [Jaapia argillacea MUCL 33604]
MNVEDVTEDLLEPCVWALHTILRMIEESSNDDLRAAGFLLPTDCAETAKANQKCIRLGRPKEAIAPLETECLNNSQIVPEPWLVNPALFGHLAEALARTGIDDKRAKILYKQVLQNPKLEIVLYVSARSLLPRVLRRLGDVNLAKSHESWVVKWLRKNPHLLLDIVLRTVLIFDDGSITPILKKLGGMSWFGNRKHTDKTDSNLTKCCPSCGARETEKKLSFCAGCGHARYCSRECQVQNWPVHKGTCKDIQLTLKTVQVLAATDPTASQRLADWNQW